MTHWWVSETQELRRVTEKCRRSSQKLVVIGGTMETARRASVSAWNGFVDCNTISLLVFPPETRSAVKSQNSVLLDRALLPGGLSGKWFPAVVSRWPPRTELTLVDFLTHSMIGTLPPTGLVSKVSIRKLTFRDRRLTHWLSKVRVRSGRVLFSAIDLLTPSSNPHGDEAGSLISRRGLWGATPSLSLRLVTSLMTRKRMRRSFTVIENARWHSSRVQVSQLLIRIRYCCRSAHLDRHDTHHLLPRPLVEGGSRLRPISPCSVLNPQRSPEQNATRISGTPPS